jgi:hypothetical protein
LKKRHSQSVASKRYLNILYLAARQSETAVDDALRMLIDKNMDISDERVEAIVGSKHPVPTATEIKIPAVDLTCYDQLFEEVVS